MPPNRPPATALVGHAGPWGAGPPPAMGWRIGGQGHPVAAVDAADEHGGGVGMPADLLAGCYGTGWNPKDPVALVTDYRCCSEGMWRDRMEPHGNRLGLLITQRSRVQIPPPPPLLSWDFASHLLSWLVPSGWLSTGLSTAGSAIGCAGPVPLPRRMSCATAWAAAASRPGSTWL